MSDRLFFLCGKTGGPFFPYKALAKEFGADYEIVYIGVKNSFEQKISEELNLKIEFLPEAKLGLLSFKKQKISELFKNITELLTLFFKLVFATFKAFFLILKYKPKAIFSTGSFLNIPVTVALKIYNLFSYQKIKLVVHQQDPCPGIANKFASRFADYLTYTFDYTKEHFKTFKKAKKIPNPIYLPDYQLDKNSALQALKQKDSKIFNFFEKNKTKPTLFIFGGGSGSRDINTWVFKNLDLILQDFNLFHLTGALQTEDYDIPDIKSENYFCCDKLTWQMPLVMILSDIVVCRAGIGSATELEVLAKKAFLVPLPHSHQELNAKVLSDKFGILSQDEHSQWLAKIKESLTQENGFKSDPEQIQKGLENHYSQLKKFIA
jgi:UDP-N-acetylglucosamine--N-acetylmuramyl-(pentapeptide) pyrophosphoryl-undecaprenol N-acetylglucosamine transferase